MSESKHTPWRYKEPQTGTLQSTKIYGPPHKDGSDYACLCELRDIEDAIFIVQAVNSHDALLDACKAWEKAIKSGSLTACDLGSLMIAGEAVEKTKAALALAEKEG